MHNACELAGIYLCLIQPPNPMILNVNRPADHNSMDNVHQINLIQINLQPPALICSLHAVSTDYI